MKCLIFLVIVSIGYYFLTVHLVEKGIEYGRAYAMEEQISWGWGYAIHNECEVVK